MLIIHNGYSHSEQINKQVNIKKYLQVEDSVYTM